MIKNQILKAFLILISSGLLVKQAESASCVGAFCPDYIGSVVEDSLTCNNFYFYFFFQITQIKLVLNKGLWILLGVGGGLTLLTSIGSCIYCCCWRKPAATQVFISKIISTFFIRFLIWKKKLKVVMMQPTPQVIQPIQHYQPNQPNKLIPSNPNQQV